MLSTAEKRKFGNGLFNGCNGWQFGNGLFNGCNGCNGWQFGNGLFNGCNGCNGWKESTAGESAIKNVLTILAVALSLLLPVFTFANQSEESHD
ncbi:MULTISPECIES: hypothetical protein [unclassified Microcoleus]|uniref:hypothetical protein n=1 Tax=unclassified Microcoleus TaxID=2642155 RepID=UPI002FD13DC0